MILKQLLFFTLFLNYALLNAYNAVVPYNELPPPAKPITQAGDFLILENPSDSGMFAVFNSVLGALNLYEHGSYAGLTVNLNSGRYLDISLGPNWWEYFFKPIYLGQEIGPSHTFSLAEYMHLALIDCPKKRIQANKLIQKYIHLQPHIQDEIEIFSRQYFSGHYMIGVHHRGTDKIDEVPIVSYEKTYATLLKIIKQLPRSAKNNFQIYVATDEQQFLTFLETRFPNRIISSEIARSTDGTALHSYMTPFYQSTYEMGKGAVIDCILLSKCAVLIRPGASSLSWISSCFNPEMKVINL